MLATLIIPLLLCRRTRRCGAPSLSSRGARRSWTAATGAPLIWLKLLGHTQYKEPPIQVCCLYLWSHTSSRTSSAVRQRRSRSLLCGRGFTKFARDDYLQWKKEGRLVNDGVNAKVRAGVSVTPGVNTMCLLVPQACRLQRAQLSRSV